MKQRELLILSVGVFLTMIAFVFITVYHIQNEAYINREIRPVDVPPVSIDTKIYDILKAKN